MRYGVLGVVRVERNGIDVHLHGRLRRLLAVLLCRAGAAVSPDELIEVIWSGSPPRTARTNLQVYVHQLRRALGDEVTLSRTPAGYALPVERDELDASRFEDGVRRGERLLRSGELEQGRVCLRGALALWRGPAYADLSDIPPLRLEADRLAERRLAAVEQCAEADLALSDHAEVVADLTPLVTAHPWREGLVRHLMVALYRSGRQADALRVYRDARRSLVDELGIEPGPALREAEHAVLRHDPALALPARGSRAVAAEQTHRVPAELPPVVSAFTGRRAELTRLDALLDDDRGVRTAVISAVAGAAGVGKTALAVRWAHHVRDRFPDGQLYVDLRGYDPERPVDPADALAGFLASLGVAGPDIPLDPTQRAARYRSTVADKRMLILIDNASTVSQVRPLLPGTASCAVVVTSRDSLVGLVAVDGAHRIHLDVLPHADAIYLLERIIGTRVAAEPDATDELAAVCGRLPLALRIAANLVVTEPDATIAGLVAQLRDQQRRLDLLSDPGDQRADVRAVFSWSVRHLSAPTARVYRLLGLHPAPDFEVYAVAALTGHGVDEANRVLDRLVRAHLVTITVAGRYAMHDMVRAHAADLAAAEDPEADRNAALDRLLAYYRGAVARATGHPVPPTGGPRSGTDVTVPEFTDSRRAHDWLDAERSTLVAITAHAADQRPGAAVELSTMLFRYFAVGHPVEGMALHGHACAAANRTGDRAGEAHTRMGLGAAYGLVGAYPAATEQFARAAALFVASGDRLGQVRALGNLGNIDERLGRHLAAVELQSRVLELFREIGNAMGEASALINLGNLERRLGRYAAAIEHLGQALALWRRLDDPVGEAMALTGLGEAEERRGDLARAGDHLRACLVIAGEHRIRSVEGWALTTLGVVEARLGHLAHATERHLEALATFRETGDRDGEPCALNGLGEATLAAGHPAEARSYHEAALAILVGTNARDQQARGHLGLGRAREAIGALGAAAEAYERAECLYTDLAMPEADEARARLGKIRAAAHPSGSL